MFCGASARDRETHFEIILYFLTENCINLLGQTCEKRKKINIQVNIYIGTVRY